MRSPFAVISTLSGAKIFPRRQNTHPGAAIRQVDKPNLIIRIAETAFRQLDPTSAAGGSFMGPRADKAFRSSADIARMSFVATTPRVLMRVKDTGALPGPHVMGAASIELGGMILHQFPDDGNGAQRFAGVLVREDVLFRPKKEMAVGDSKVVVNVDLGLEALNLVAGIQHASPEGCRVVAGASQDSRDSVEMYLPGEQHASLTMSSPLQRYVFAGAHAPFQQLPTPGWRGKGRVEDAAEGTENIGKVHPVLGEEEQQPVPACRVELKGSVAHLLEHCAAGKS
jgi:hypothetical protein